SRPGSSLDDIDLDKLGRNLGDDAVVDARTLSELERALRDSGYLRRADDGTLALSPKALRRLGRELLRDTATRLSTRAGERDTRLTGAAGERTGASRPRRFGDAQPWDVPGSPAHRLARPAA